jgi:hypothetical protein
MYSRMTVRRATLRAMHSGSGRLALCLQMPALSSERLESEGRYSTGILMGFQPGFSWLAVHLSRRGCRFNSLRMER